MTIRQGAMGAAALLTALRTPNASRFLVDSKRQGCSLSAILDDQLEIDSADKRQGVDAFQRLMEEADIVSRSVPEAGVYADTMGDLIERAGRALTVEWCWRQYRRGQGVTGQRSFASSTENLASSAMTPYAEASMLTQDMLMPQIPIAEVIASEQGIDSDSFRKIILTEPTAAEKRLVRVGEGAPIPVTKLQVSDGIISMYKFGRGLEITDEARRRERLDRVAIMIQLMAVQNEIDKLAAIIDVMVNGDAAGYGAATSYNLTTLDAAATAGTLTAKGWMAFCGKWDNPYIATHALAPEAMALQLKLLNTGSANLRLEVLPPQYVATVRPINPRINPTVALGQTADAPANKILAFDRRVTVERLFEIGAATEENTRYVERQAEAVFFTEVEGFHILDRNGPKLLVVNA